jgi:hypothetical protein
MNTIPKCTLAVALIAAMGMSSPAFAQRAADARAKAAAKVSTAVAADAARDAREATKEAKKAAKDAARTGDDVHAHVARGAAVAAEEAKNDAVNASQETMGASAQAQGGVNRDTAAVEARAAAMATERARERANAASAVARDTAADAAMGPPAVVPVSPNASANARIATSEPGAMAAHRHMTGAGRFHLDTVALDTNRDGFLSQAEVAGNVSLTTDFAAIDTNSDARLAADELRTWIRAGGLSRHARPLGDLLSGTGLSADARFDLLDLDDDGALTSREAGMHAGLRSNFRALDRNRDGRLSSSEFSTWTETGGTR